MKYLYIIIMLFCLTGIKVLAQIEHVPISNPVYDFLSQAEIRGAIEHISLSNLPLQREDIVKYLKEIRKNQNKMSSSELQTLNKFEIEFEIKQRNNAVLFYSESDSEQVLSSKFFSDDEKFIYHYKDSINTVNVTPLGSFRVIGQDSSNTKQNVQLGQLGIRLFGSLGSHFGYYLQATNGIQFGGEKSLALEDPYLKQNVKFADLNSDFDFTESHIIYENSWFNASIGRESRQIGSGIINKLFVSTNAPAYDALNFGAKFDDFEYKFTHASLLAIPDNNAVSGSSIFIESKYLAMHNFILKPSWGEIAYWEGMVYSNREYDLAYLNPLGFFKSLEHALRDRDNSLMGGWLTLRFIDNFQIKGSWLLDDIIIPDIGKGFWSNKTAWNFGLMYSPPIPLNLGIEYARVEPYTFTHFNIQNSYTNDKMLIGTELLPNSDETSLQCLYWWGGRYPIKLRLSYIRHGANIYENDTLIRNVGGDPLQTKRPYDSEKVTFLDGNRINTVMFLVQTGFELWRGFNLQCYYQLKSVNNNTTNSVSLMFRFEDF